MSRLISNTASLSVGFTFAQVLTAVAYLIAARSLGPSQFGEVAAYVGVATLLVVAGDFGLNAWSIREIAQSGSGEVFAASLSVRSAVAVAAGSAWVCATGVLALLGVAPGYSILLGVWIASALLWNMLLAPLQAGERMHQVAVVTAAERLVLVVVVGLGTLIGIGALSVTIGLAVGGILAAALAAAMLDSPMRRISVPAVREVRDALRLAFGFGASNLAIQLQRLDVAIVSVISGSLVAGIYAAPARLTGLLGVLPNSFSTSLFPRAARQRGPIWNRKFIFSLLLLSTIMLVVVAPIFVFAETLIVHILGPEYQASTSVLRVVLVGMIFASINQPIAMTYQARGFENLVARAITIGSCIGLASVGLGASMLGATGAAFGFVVLQISVLCILIFRSPAIAPDATIEQTLIEQA